MILITPKWFKVDMKLLFFKVTHASFTNKLIRLYSYKTILPLSTPGRYAGHFLVIYVHCRISSAWIYLSQLIWYLCIMLQPPPQYCHLYALCYCHHHIIAIISGYASCYGCHYIIANIVKFLVCMGPIQKLSGEGFTLGPSYLLTGANLLRYFHHGLWKGLEVQSFHIGPSIDQTHLSLWWGASYSNRPITPGMSGCNKLGNYIVYITFRWVQHHFQFVYTCSLPLIQV